MSWHSNEIQKLLNECLSRDAKISKALRLLDKLRADIETYNISWSRISSRINEIEEVLRDGN